MKSNRKNTFLIVKKFILLFFGMSLLPLIVFAQSYNPPIGIPAPEFGINETVESVYGADSLYTHYVDNTHPEATDVDNPNGNSDKPRKTIPLNVSAGSIVEIHGGPYNNIRSTYIMSGTVDEPVFVRGVPDTIRPLITRSEVRFGGQYFIVENLEFYNKSTIRFNTSARYGSLRNCEVHNPIGATGASNPTINVTGEHMVIYNCEIHDNIREADIDCHGIQAGNYGYKIWVLDNHIYNNGGDGIQACHNCNPGPRYLYIGRNNFHGDKENGIDLKYALDVIISENKLHNYLHSATTGIVSPIVVGSDGAPTRVWIIFNEIYNSKKGIRIEEIHDIWIIGNLIYDITEAGIIPEKVGTRTRVLNNTLYNMAQGISDPWRVTFGFSIYNNIYSKISNSSIKLGSSILENSDISNNVFWEASSHGDNAVNENPLFTDEANKEFSLQSESPAIDAGIAKGEVYYDYYSMYGVDISKDVEAAIRPQGEEWDIGAHEYPTGTFPVQYNLIAAADAAMGNVSPTGGKFTEGSVVKLTAIAKPGYIFIGWSGDLSGSENPSFLTMDSNKSITALFKELTLYTLTVNTSGKGTVSIDPDSVYYSPGRVVTLTANPDDGEEFVEWKGDLSGSENPQQITMDENKTVTAIFTSPANESFNINAIGTQIGMFEASWIAFASADKVDGVIGFSQGIPSEYDHLSCKILFKNTGDLEVSNGADYTSDAAVPYSANQQFSFRMSVDMNAQIYSVWVTPDGADEILLADSYAFHPAPGTISSIKYRSIKMSFDPQWGGAEGMIEILNFNVVTDIDNEFENLQPPSHYSLSSYPNPFNPTAMIEYHVPQACHVGLNIYNSLGQKVESLVSGNIRAGSYKIKWDASGYAAGTYFSRLETSMGQVISNKMILLK